MPDTGAPAGPQREGTARWPAFLVHGVLATAVLACLGTAAVQVFGGDTSSGPVGSFVPVQPSASAQPGKTPKASSLPVRGSDDLGRVCEGWFYPDSPRYSGRGPHRIAIGVRGQEPFYRVKAAVDVPHTVKRAVREAWMPDDATEAELVACVTLARTGAQVTTCGKAALKRGVYVLALHEVATGRRLLRREVNGDVLRCPNVIPLGAGDTIPTTVSDGFLYSVLDRYVTRKLTVSRR
ncbi:hypothetical protein [Paractinoplanes brasiliensis]|uniref:Uncharacterized protein n=1 Tax=Paractinoplanes brasiliensis TaxID=52695 RepID=A0A4R6JZF0_9ACTN|nr:hypothetical protein [Actinoplanes brasiliensis]TDO41141.1 hypothetical protein C8E87_4870 [Actinoplanes brasiliensis]GID26211.1 hypothetical protein Abr02nite_11940 [Actinoplanes brasiliensis]